jgi:hypothetical protein
LDESPSPSPSTTPPSTPPSTTTPHVPVTATYVLAETPAGKDPVPQELTPNAYPGLVLYAVPATGTSCSKGVSWVELHDPAGAHGIVAGEPGGAGLAACNDSSLRIGFQQPVARVELQFVAASILGPNASPGATPAVSQSTSPPARLPFSLLASGISPVTKSFDEGEAATLSLQAPTGKTFTEVTLSGRPPGAGVFAVLTGVTVTGP